MATDKTPTQSERIETLEGDVSKLEKQVAAITKALASADPSLIAAALAK